MFTPAIKLIEVDPDLAYIEVQDDASNYGQADGPADFDDIDGFMYITQKTGEDPVTQSVTEGSLDSGIKIKFAVTDGVFTITVLMLKHITGLTYTYSNSNKTLTFSGGDPSALFASAYAISGDGGTSYGIISTKSSTTLVTDVATLGDGTDLWAYYKAELPVLVEVNAKLIIKNAIADLAVANDCNNFEITINVLQKILLKLAAETFFECEEYVTAEKALDIINAETTCNCACS